MFYNPRANKNNSDISTVKDTIDKSRASILFQVFTSSFSHLLGESRPTSSYDEVFGLGFNCTIGITFKDNDIYVTGFGTSKSSAKNEAVIKFFKVIYPNFSTLEELEEIINKEKLSFKKLSKKRELEKEPVSVSNAKKEPVSVSNTIKLDPFSIVLDKNILKVKSLIFNNLFPKNINIRRAVKDDLKYIASLVKRDKSCYSIDNKFLANLGVQSDSKNSPLFWFMLIEAFNCGRNEIIGYCFISICSYISGLSLHVDGCFIESPYEDSILAYLYIWLFIAKAENCSLELRLTKSSFESLDKNLDSISNYGEVLMSSENIVLFKILSKNVSKVCDELIFPNTGKMI